MKFKDKEYVFSKDKVTNVWLALNEAQVICDNKKKKISVKTKEKNKIYDFEKKFKSQNIIRCSLERIEDILEYLDNFQLCVGVNGRNAFDFIEFINLEYVLVHCIIELANVFGTNYKRIKYEKVCFKELHLGNSSDYDTFEYIRSLCAVHPLETSLHPYVHGFKNFHCCSRIRWDNGRVYGDNRDLTMVIYSGNENHKLIYSGLKVSCFVDYINKWIDFLDEIEKSIYRFISYEEEQLRTLQIKTPEEFDDYLDYIDNLRNEYKKRQGSNHLYLFDRYKLAFQVEFLDENIQRKKECYQNAIKYMFSFLHKELQDMDEKNNTGIVDLPDNMYTSLFLELHNPIAKGSVFANERSAFEYIDNLNSSYDIDVMMARQVLEKLKPNINKFVPFKNTETAEQTSVLLQIATYCEALGLDGHIGRSIPNEPKYRIE